MIERADDVLIRTAAFAALDRLMAGRGVLAWGDISKGFTVPGFSSPLMFASRAIGIFKPKEMTQVLSVRTVMPRRGREVWYKDQDESRQALYEGDETVRYSFRGDDPGSWDNQLLRAAAEGGAPLIYFLAVAPAVYVPIYPAFVVEWRPDKLEVALAVSQSFPAGKVIGPPTSAIEKRYRLAEVKQRVHQAEFREAVLEAYGCRCAITGLPVRDLLDASHIVPDADHRWGQPEVTNGLPLSKIHHAAYDADLIGIDPDGFVHVSDRLHAECTEPHLVEVLASMRSLRIRRPRLGEDWPDTVRLALRFERYMAAN